FFHRGVFPYDVISIPDTTGATQAGIAMKTLLQPYTSTAPRLPWGLYTVLAMLITAYSLAPLGVNSLILLLWPMIPPGLCLLVTDLPTVACWGLIFRRLHRACLADQSASPLRDILGLNFKQPWTYYVRESLLAIAVSFALIYAMNALRVVTGTQGLG